MVLSKQIIDGSFLMGDIAIEINREWHGDVYANLAGKIKR